MGVLARSSGEHFFKISNDQLDVLAAGLDLENLSGIVDEMDDEPCLAPCSGKSDKRSLRRHENTDSRKDVTDGRPRRQLCT